MKSSIQIIIFTLILILGAATSPLAANSAAPKLLSTYGEWSVYTFPENTGRVCFMSTQPSKKEGDYKKRGQVFMFVTRWSNSKEKNVVSISNGYSFKKDSAVNVTIGKKNYKMFTQGEMAWTKDNATDNEMTTDIKKSASLTVEGTSKTDTKTKDTYNLKGSVDAYKAMVKACK